jgi:hypothetical protein
VRGYRRLQGGGNHVRDHHDAYAALLDVGLVASGDGALGSGRTRKPRARRSRAGPRGRFPRKRACPVTADVGASPARRIPSVGLTSPHDPGWLTNAQARDGRRRRRARARVVASPPGRRAHAGTRKDPPRRALAGAWLWASAQAHNLAPVFRGCLPTQLGVADPVEAGEPAV